jgi:integrase
MTNRAQALLREALALAPDERADVGAELSRPIGSWKTASARAKRVAGVKARFHDARPTTCTRMLEGGVPLSVVATIMGWSAGTTALLSVICQSE